MAKTKKVKKITPEEVEEAIEEVLQEVDVEDQKEKFQTRLAYLQDLRKQLDNEGVDSVGKLDTITARVIQELSLL